MSLGAPQAPPDDFYNAVKEAHAAGIIMVAAAGNDAGAVNWPARYDEVIAVSAIDNQGNLANFSSHGDQIDFGAPGVNIYSTYLNNQYAILNGTSQASPFIAGVCALLLSWTRSHPELPQIKNSDDMLIALGKFTDPAGRLTDGKFGLGIPHFANALTDDKADTQSNPPVAPEMPIVPVVIPPATPTEPVATTPTPVPPKPHDNLNVSDPF
jgi:subtilisin